VTGRIATSVFRISTSGAYLNGFETSFQSLFQKSLDFVAFAFGFAAPVAACGGGVDAAAGSTVAVVVACVVAVLVAAVLVVAVPVVPVLAELPAGFVPVPPVAAGVVLVVVAPLVDDAAVDAAVFCPVAAAAVDGDPVVPVEVVPCSRASRSFMGVVSAGVVCAAGVVAAATEGLGVWTAGVTET